MKSLRKLCAAVVLTLAIAVPAFPGDISCPGVKSTHTHTVGVAGDISCPGVSLLSETPAPELAPIETTSNVAALDPVTGFMLSLFQGLLSLF